MRHIKTVEVAGRVVASDGRPVTHSYVELYTAEAANDELSASANAKGEFSIKGVPQEAMSSVPTKSTRNERHMRSRNSRSAPTTLTPS